MSEPFIAEVRLFPYNFAPRDWAFCTGDTLSISQFSPLYALIGDMYGSATSTTFRLPDLSSPYAYGVAATGQRPGGARSWREGDQYGTPSVALTENNLPGHDHTEVTTAFSSPLNVGAEAGGTKLLCQSLNSSGPPSINFNEPQSQTTEMDQETIGATGGQDSHPNRQPYLCLPFCIALTGIFPTRS